MSNPFQAVLEAVHEEYEKNTDYPDTTSEDFVVRRRYGNNGIKEWEKEAKEGVSWDSLRTAASIAAGGTGTDALPTDFLNFMRANEQPAVISDGTHEWEEISMQDGNKIVQDGITGGNIFWVEAGNIRTLPAITGTITFPYLRKATRYPIGTEADELDMDDYFLQEYILAQLYLDDADLSSYQAHMQAAKDALDSSKYKAIVESPKNSYWGFGM